VIIKFGIICPGIILTALIPQEKVGYHEGMKQAFFAGAAVFFALALPAYAANGSTTDAAAEASHVHGAQTVSILMTAQGFEPSEVTINQGDTVIFENIDAADHWPASDIHPTHQIYPAFDPKRGIAPDQSWSFVFTREGSWGMHDHLNPQFTGTIHVEKVDGFIDTSASSTSAIPSGFFHDIKMGVLRIYYKIFPSKLQAKLAGVELMKLGVDDKDIAYWLELIGSKGVMTKILAESGNGATVDCHTIAHQVGRVAYSLYGASVFKDGDDSCHSGFYHGAMESLIAEKGTDNFDQTVSDLCTIFDTRFGTFECLHGVGHGVLAFTNYDLTKALGICKELPTEFDQRSCYGGAYMENVVTGMGQGAKPDHTTTWLSRTDPLYPCDALPDDFKMVDDCYLMQTSWMLYISNYNYPLVVSDCLEAPALHQHTCFKSFGRDAAGNSLRDPNQIVAYCSMVPQDSNEYMNDCISGGVNVIIDFWGEKYTNQADPVCDLLSGSEALACRNLIAERKRDDLAKTPAGQSAAE
jgi:plastocyanin